uniref:JmjC domain-containing protein n=1 Tax=Alexandrium andersonii TaxID=327968 RepID=A0A7S2ALE2_9DINO|mmetsp:Transcript_13874/g.31455  ORF Transcript_13874/g.31455 Transcript_13874/m.31455 type:complete len:508 (+) Transcript_13874:3-1526(+)
MDGIMFRELLPPQPGDDRLTALCKVAMYTELVTATFIEGQDPFMPAGFNNMDTYDPVPTMDRVLSFIQACKEVYTSLDKDGPQRKLLDNMTLEKAYGKTTPNKPTTNAETIDWARKQRYVVAEQRPLHSEKWKEAKDIPDYGMMYMRSTIRPVKEEWIDASQISEAVKEGKVAVFDATKLLGKELFNLSMPDIARLHGESAKNIPMYRQKGPTGIARTGIDNLRDYAARTKAWKDRKQLRWPENKPFRAAGHWTADDIQEMATSKLHGSWWMSILYKLVNLFLQAFQIDLTMEDMQRTMRQHILQCAINTRRLPELPMPKLEDALGNPDWLERAWSMFWLGPVADCWHYDDPDNLLIGVYGDIWVSVFQLKDRELMRGGADRGCWNPMLEPMPKRIDTFWTQQADGWLEKFEFINLKLEPGMGIVVPSGAFHSLTMADGDRILLNCFMIPKYKGLWDVAASNYTFYNSKWQSEEYHALSQLKKSSIFRLWDTKKLGGFFEGTKLEML